MKKPPFNPNPVWGDRLPEVGERVVTRWGNMGRFQKNVGNDVWLILGEDGRKFYAENCQVQRLADVYEGIRQRDHRAAQFLFPRLDIEILRAVFREIEYAYREVGDATPK